MLFDVCEGLRSPVELEKGKRGREKERESWEVRAEGSLGADCAGSLRAARRTFGFSQSRMEPWEGSQQEEDVI